METISPRAARHSAKSSDWRTPMAYVEAARLVMKDIDLDPASDEEANRIVRAHRYFTKAEDGLVQPWSGRVFLNPPGGQAKQFWNRLTDHYHRDEVSEAIFVGYSLEQLQSFQVDTRWSPLDFVLCFPKRRIQFMSPEGRMCLQPTHGNYIAYMGPEPSRFVWVFTEFGKVMT